MNKIVRRHYPVTALPEDLRAGLPKEGWVDITLVPESGSPAPKRLAELVGSGKNVHGTERDVIAHIRSIRDGT